jgi:hypothetical protein
MVSNIWLYGPDARELGFYLEMAGLGNQKLRFNLNIW